MGALSVKKVRGEAHPADVFTKHLPSREKVHQLLGLFGCEYRDGRPTSAPSLRPMSSVNQEGGHLVEGHLPAFMAAEAELHDITRLPHMHSVDEITRLFPTIDAAAPCENDCDSIPPTQCEKQDEQFLGDRRLMNSRSGAIRN